MRFWISALVAVVAALGLALSPVNEYFFFAAFVVLTYVLLATAWNILGGYAGYVNFGTPAFFGTGAYTAVVLFKWLGAPLAVQIAAGAAMGGLLGFGVGMLTLRLRGIFFAIGTLAAPMIGGTTHWLGPVIGALLLVTIQQIVTVTISSEINVLVVGVLLVLFVVLAPDGILGFFKRWLRASSR